MTDTYRIAPEVLDRIRDLHGLTSDEQIAPKVGVSVGTIHRVRRGESPSFTTAIRLLDLAGVTLAGIRRVPNAAAA